MFKLHVTTIVSQGKDMTDVIKFDNQEQADIAADNLNRESDIYEVKYRVVKLY